jgi:hypothetical protein
MSLAANTLPLLWSIMIVTLMALAVIMFIFRKWAKTSQQLVKDYVEKNKS